MINTLNIKPPTSSALAPLALFSGIRVLESEHCKERIQWRFPRSKKKRIRMKWAKREENVRYEPRAYQYGPNTIICHPSYAQRLREELPLNKDSATKKS